MPNVYHTHQMLKWSFNIRAVVSVQVVKKDSNRPICEMFSGITFGTHSSLHVCEREMELAIGLAVVMGVWIDGWLGVEVTISLLFTKERGSHHLPVSRLSSDWSYASHVWINILCWGEGRGVGGQREG